MTKLGYRRIEKYYTKDVDEKQMYIDFIEDKKLTKEFDKWAREWC